MHRQKNHKSNPTISDQKKLHDIPTLPINHPQLSGQNRSSSRIRRARSETSPLELKKSHSNELRSITPRRREPTSPAKDGTRILYSPPTTPKGKHQRKLSTSHLEHFISPRKFRNDERQHSFAPNRINKSTTSPRASNIKIPKHSADENNTSTLFSLRGSLTSSPHVPRRSVQRRRSTSEAQPLTTLSSSPRSRKLSHISKKLHFTLDNEASQTTNMVSPKSLVSTSQSSESCPLMSPRSFNTKNDDSNIKDVSASVGTNSDPTNSNLFSVIREQILPAVDMAYDPALCTQQIEELEERYVKTHGEGCINTEPFVVTDSQDKTLVALESFTFSPKDARNMVILYLCGNAVLMQNTLNDIIKDALTLNCTVITINHRNVGGKFSIREASSESPIRTVYNDVYQTELDINEKRKLAPYTAPSLGEIHNDVYKVVLSIIGNRKLNPSCRLVIKGRSLGGAIGAYVVHALHNNKKKYPVFFFSDRSYDDMANLVTNYPKILTSFGLFMAGCKSSPGKVFKNIDEKYRAFVVALHDGVIPLSKSIYALLKKKDKNNNELEKSILFTPAPLDSIAILLNYIKHLPNKNNEQILKPEIMNTLVDYLKEESTIIEPLKKIFYLQCLFHPSEKCAKHESLKVTGAPLDELRKLYGCLKTLLSSEEKTMLKEYEEQIAESNNISSYPSQNFNNEETSPLDAVIILLNHIENSTNKQNMLSSETIEKLSTYAITESKNLLIKQLSKLFDFLSLYPRLEDLKKLKNYESSLIDNLFKIPFQELKILYNMLKRTLTRDEKTELNKSQQYTADPHNFPLYKLQGLDGESGEEKFYQFFFKACSIVAEQESNIKTSTVTARCNSPQGRK